MAGFQSPILENLKRGVRRLFGSSSSSSGADQAAFRFKYVNFQELLESNAELLKVISLMELRLGGQEIFGMDFLQSSTSQAVFHSMRMVRGYENMSGRPQPVLRKVIDDVRQKIRSVLDGAPEEKGPLFQDFDALRAADAWLVGGKCANLGEMKNGLGLPVPEGFAITTAAFRAFFEHAGLSAEIAKRCMGLNAADPNQLQQASEDIQRMILLAPFCEGFEEELLARHEALAARMNRRPDDIEVAVRSSAVGEDGELSFAGQYLSVLGVVRTKLAESYRYVAASLYTPRAMAYRLLKGVPDEDSAMAVACLAMVESRSSGVMYTKHPFEPGDQDIFINAVWGLGPYAVDGVVSPDHYVADKKTLAVRIQDVAGQNVRLVCKPGGGVMEAAVEEDLQAEPCLDKAAISTLAGWGKRLEEHYGGPQDVEWALDTQGRLILLQCRPLGEASSGKAPGEAAPPVPGYEILLEGGETACPGVGCGKVFLVRGDEDLAAFPEDGVLVGRHSSPKFMLAMAKTRAIVTDHGSVTGHMASLSREFAVPTLLGLESATTCLHAGETVTVDAGSRRIYRGRVEELLKEVQTRPAPMKGTPVYGLLEELTKSIAPLHLLDPKAPEFSPSHCSTLHDIARYLHERSYAAMFTIGDKVSGEAGMAVKLEAGIGLDLHVIDLGGGIAPEASNGGVPLEMIRSRPFKALMQGLAHESFVHRDPRPVQLRGFLSVVGRQMVDGPTMGAERFGDRSYAIISDKYCNFSSRVGYHYGVVDCYCGQSVSKNYITFAFKGGAAGEDRRERRARAIALILSRLGFAVSATADRVEGRFQKYPGEMVEAKLVELGKLLQFTRQTDMLMTSESAVTAMAESFLRGETMFGYAGHPPDGCA